MVAIPTTFANEPFLSLQLSIILNACCSISFCHDVHGERGGGAAGLPCAIIYNGSPAAPPSSLARDNVASSLQKLATLTAEFELED